MGWHINAKMFLQHLNPIRDVGKSTSIVITFPYTYTVNNVSIGKKLKKSSFYYILASFSWVLGDLRPDKVFLRPFCQNLENCAFFTCPRPDILQMELVQISFPWAKLNRQSILSIFLTWEWQMRSKMIVRFVEIDAINTFGSFAFTDVFLILRLWKFQVRVSGQSDFNAQWIRMLPFPPPSLSLKWNFEKLVQKDRTFGLAATQGPSFIHLGV